MKRINHSIIFLSVTFLSGLSLLSCAGDDYQQPGTTICVNTAPVGATRADKETDNTFMLLFWHEIDQLKSEPVMKAPWPDPYLAIQAPQPVSFYRNSVFDTRTPYPPGKNDASALLYATGYAPGNMLRIKDRYNDGYKRLKSYVPKEDLGRYDFLGLDFWPDVYKGSIEEPFAQKKNKLFFRHLAAKLVFYADRDLETMENKQYVRKVIVTNLRMDIDGTDNWIPLHTPSEFEWQELVDDDFSDPYKKVIKDVIIVNNNTDNDISSDSRPETGYKAVASVPFTGEGSGFKIDKGVPDRVPIEGMVIDSCYVCNPITSGNVQHATDRIRLKMDISAEMSFHPDFLKGDEDDGSNTDDLTFTRIWEGVILDKISQVSIDEKGNVTPTKETAISEFKAGKEYRIYIHFYRSGVNLVAQELPWNYGGVHYISISGADPKPDSGTDGTGTSPN